MNEGFQFKQFYVRHDRCAMKVGTDGVLLGALVCGDDVCNRSGDVLKVLDAGCGSGLIALMLAQRFTAAQVWAVDIDAEAAAQAQANFNNSPWAERMTAMCGDIRALACDAALEAGFDLVVSNPPFYDNSPDARDAARDAARRADTLSYEQLARAASRLLRVGGRFAVILPHDRSGEFVHTCWLCGLQHCAQTDVRTKETKPLKRSVLEFVKDDTAHALKTTTLTLLDENGERSRQYANLCRDFYLDKP